MSRLISILVKTRFDISCELPADDSHEKSNLVWLLEAGTSFGNVEYLLVL